MWIIMVYIVWVRMQWSKYDKIAKQNVSRVSRGKALPARHSRKPLGWYDFSSSSHVLYMWLFRRQASHETLAKTSCLHPILTLRIPVICRAHASLREKPTRELPAKTALVFNCLKSSHSLSHTTLTNKSHIKYTVHKIKQNYNQIWHGIKANIHQL